MFENCESCFAAEQFVDIKLGAKYLLTLTSLYLVYIITYPMPFFNIVSAFLCHFPTILTLKSRLTFICIRIYKYILEFPCHHKKKTRTVLIQTMSFFFYIFIFIKMSCCTGRRITSCHPYLHLRALPERAL